MKHLDEGNLGPCSGTIVTWLVWKGLQLLANSLLYFLLGNVIAEVMSVSKNYSSSSCKPCVHSLPLLLLPLTFDFFKVSLSWKWFDFLAFTNTSK